MCGLVRVVDGQWLVDAGLLPERGNCEVYELKDITSQIRH
jgi:hypothetical protein